MEYINIIINKFNENRPYLLNLLYELIIIIFIYTISYLFFYIISKWSLTYDSLSDSLEILFYLTPAIISLLFFKKSIKHLIKSYLAIIITIYIYWVLTPGGWGWWYWMLMLIIYLIFWFFWIIMIYFIFKFIKNYNKKNILLFLLFIVIIQYTYIAFLEHSALKKEKNLNRCTNSWLRLNPCPYY